ncbi:MAG: helix-turn-helix domain-containing protein, partial [Microvirga sp.]
EVFDRLGRRASEPLRAVRNGSTLRHTAEEFLRLHGNWQQSADALGCHRHTLRYRVRRIEELYGCSFDEAGDRVDLWLGLRAWQASEDWDQIA